MMASYDLKGCYVPETEIFIFLTLEIIMLTSPLKNVEISDDVFKQTEAIINSMTPLEREKPEIIDAKRRARLAKGCLLYTSRCV